MKYVAAIIATAIGLVLLGPLGAVLGVVIWAVVLSSNAKKSKS